MKEDTDGRRCEGTTDEVDSITRAVAAVEAEDKEIPAIAPGAGPNDSRVSTVYAVAVMMQCDCGKTVVVAGAEAVELGLTGAGIVAACSCGVRLYAHPSPSSPRIASGPNRKQRRAALAGARRTKAGLILP